MSSIDTAVCIFDPTIVQAFRQPAVTLEPPNFKDNFESHEARDGEDAESAKTMTEVFAHLEKANDASKTRLLQWYLLAGLVDFKVGLYSGFHEKCIWLHGYDHPDTNLIAWL